MDSTPYDESIPFVELLTSQEQGVFPGCVDPSSSEAPLFCSQTTETSNFGVQKGTERSTRRTWRHSDDVVLISAWLNTSKDPLIGNEQASGAFWKRIAAFYAASPNIALGEESSANQCKHRWHKINEQVSKFSGAYESATRQKTSGQNEVDVIKLAHDIFLTNYGKKFTLEHAWRELRYDQKWCGNEGSNKRRKLGDGSHSATESVKDNNVDEAVADDGMNRPPGVKATKARGKKRAMVEGKEVSDFQTMWNPKKEDLVRKERLGKMKLIEKLLGKKEPLCDEEEALKKKLMVELMSN